MNLEKTKFDTCKILLHFRPLVITTVCLIVTGIRLAILLLKDKTIYLKLCVYLQWN